MTVLFMDVYEDEELAIDLAKDRPPNHEDDDILYADDTIIFSTNNITLEKLLHKIEDESEYYNLNLNNKKCPVIETNGEFNIIFKNLPA